MQALLGKKNCCKAYLQMRQGFSYVKLQLTSALTQKAQQYTSSCQHVTLGAWHSSSHARLCNWSFNELDAQWRVTCMKKYKRENVSSVASFPCNCPVKIRWCVLQEDFASTQEQSCFLNFRSSWMFQKKHTTPKPAFNEPFLHSATCKRKIYSFLTDFFSPRYLTLSSQFYTDLHFFCFNYSLV